MSREEARLWIEEHQVYELHTLARALEVRADAIHEVLGEWGYTIHTDNPRIAPQLVERLLEFFG